MRLLSFLAVLIIPVATIASDESWKNRLYCYGTLFGSADSAVELKRSIDNDGLEREVFFSKTIDSKP